MTLAAEVGALRSSAGLTRADHILVVRVDGADALDFLQTASTQSPYVREGRVRHTLLLRDDASVFADAFIVKAEEAFLVIAEGPTEAELIAWLEALRDRTPGKQVTIQGTSEVFAVLGIDGPYAWEVIAGLLGPVALGLPYLALLRKEDILCMRAGKTGEYGYLLLVPKPAAAETEAKLLEMGRPLDLMLVTREALDVCALENWHFSMRNFRASPLATPLTPIELQLQWRVVYTREFVGVEALRARRTEGPKARVTCFTAQGPVVVGQHLLLGERDVGEVLAVCESPTLGLTVGSALIEIKLAHPHLTLSPGVRTVTASLVDNLSLRVQPHKDAYATRNAVVTP
jgi:glycine cleavage system aminomethyltransferase T